MIKKTERKKKKKKSAKKRGLAERKNYKKADDKK